MKLTLKTASSKSPSFRYRPVLGNISLDITSTTKHRLPPGYTPLLRQDTLNSADTER